MNIIVISKCAVLRAGIEAALFGHENVSILFMGETVKSSILMIKLKQADLILLHIHKDNECELEKLNELRTQDFPFKLILIDLTGSSKLFVKALECGVQGYISGKSNEEELIYAINQVYKGKKYYDSKLIEHIMNKDNIEDVQEGG